MRRTLIVTGWMLAGLCALAAPHAQAQLDAVGHSTHRVVPEQPTTQHIVAIRNDFTGCKTHGPHVAQEIRIDLATRVIDYLIPYGNDEADCAAVDYVYDAYADSTVGKLPAGAYTVRFFHCGPLFDPQSTCDLVPGAGLQFVVVEASSRRRTIPASSPASQAVLLAALALMAAWRVRRR